MKTLTITDAKKNLSRLLQSAARGEEVGIVSGADIIALRKVGVHADDYAWREYGATPEQLKTFDQAAEKRYQSAKKTGKLIELTPEKLKKLIEKKLVIDAPALSRLLELPREQKIACLLAISDIPSAFGRPHVHSGLGIRKLRPSWFECRGNLDWRIIFKDRSEDLFVAFVGNHDEVQKLLRSGVFDR